MDRDILLFLEWQSDQKAVFRFEDRVLSVGLDGQIAWIVPEGDRRNLTELFDIYPNKGSRGISLCFVLATVFSDLLSPFAGCYAVRSWCGFISINGTNNATFTQLMSAKESFVFISPG